LCFHHPQGTVAELSRPCGCRKPAPGMLLQAAESLAIDLRSSWMVGDTDADLAAGIAAGCRTLLVLNPHSAHKRLRGLRADLTASTLGEGATEIRDKSSKMITRERRRNLGCRRIA
jgi:D-glycero-D-manno-heptose 1,7-bisphosphate phosphatase